MNSFFLHSITAWLPAVSIVLIPVILRKLPSNTVGNTLGKTLCFIVVATLVVTFLTSSFGGASLKLAKSFEGTNQWVLKIHAWSGLLAVLLSVFMLFVIIRRPEISKQNWTSKRNKLLLFAFIAFAIFVVLAFCSSYYIR
jgi:cytochrome b561